MYRALDVSRHVIRRCSETGRIVSNLKLQKILYFIQADFLAETEKACFPEEIEAWDFGPVIPEVFERYLVYGNAAIPYLGIGDGIWIDPDDRMRMDAVIDECSAYSPSALEDLTNTEDPWCDAYHPYARSIISKESIQLYFEHGDHKARLATAGPEVVWL